MCPFGGFPMIALGHVQFSSFSWVLLWLVGDAPQNRLWSYSSQRLRSSMVSFCGGSFQLSVPGRIKHGRFHVAMFKWWLGEIG